MSDPQKITAGLTFLTPVPYRSLPKFLIDLPSGFCFYFIYNFNIIFKFSHHSDAHINQQTKAKQKRGETENLRFSVTLEIVGKKYKKKNLIKLRGF